MQESTIERDRDEKCVLKKKTLKGDGVRAGRGVISVYFLRVIISFHPFPWSIDTVGDSVYEKVSNWGSFGNVFFTCSHKDPQKVDITQTFRYISQIYRETKCQYLNTVSLTLYVQNTKICGHGRLVLIHSPTSWNSVSPLIRISA